jgi:antitoxin ParD1/3/4
MQTMNISLPDPMKHFVEEQVNTGAYSSVSEYVRELVREKNWKRFFWWRHNRSRRR